MGHPEPFELKYVAVGNEDCDQKPYYRGFCISLYHNDPVEKKQNYTNLDTQLSFFLSGNYLEFYKAIKNAYPDIKIISNCDGSSKPLDHPDYYDYHVKLTATKNNVKNWMKTVSCYASH